MGKKNFPGTMIERGTAESVDYSVYQKEGSARGKASGGTAGSPRKIDVSLKITKICQHISDFDFEERFEEI